MLEFFMPMKPPTVTAQEHKVTVRNGKPVYYDPPEVKDAKYILSKLKQSDKEVLTKHELLRMCRALTSDICEKQLEILEDMHCIKREIIKTGDKGRPREQIRINPLVLKSF